MTTRIGRMRVPHLSRLLVFDFLLNQVWVKHCLALLLHELVLRCAEKALQFLEGFFGTFFLQEMAAVKTVPANR